MPKVYNYIQNNMLFLCCEPRVVRHICGAREQPTGTRAAIFFVDWQAELGGNCANILSTNLDAMAIEYIVYFNYMICSTQYTLCGKYHFVDETSTPLGK